MVGIVIATHGDFSAALLSSATMIVGPQAGIEAVCLAESQSPEDWTEEFLRAAAAVDDEDGVLVLLDVFGGTPFMQSSRHLIGRRMEAVTGVNLPMVLATLENRKSLAAALEAAVGAGSTGIKDVRQSLGLPRHSTH